MQQHQTRSLRLSGRLCAALASKVFSGVSAVIALAIALSLAPVSQAFGQASSSSDAAGKVTDATGAAIPGATIHLINNGTGAERTATSNDAGDWSIPNVPPANYKIRVEKSGFKSAQIPALDVEIGKTANGSVVLSVGEVTDTVEVSALPPQLQTQEATVGQVIDQKQINDLPLNGRNVLQLATLAPGVSPAQQGQTGNPAQTGTRSLYITVDGGRGSSTNYVLDGTYVRSVRFNNMSIQPSTDTIQEFNLLRSTFSTEYGQGQAVVSMVTKSGSNTIHGSAYEFARNSVFDARNYFATTASNPVKPNFSRHQFGATIGGPIIKDKFFIFGGYEGLRSQRDTPLFALFPTQAQLNGDGRASATPLNPLRSDGTRCDPSQVSGPSAPRTGETCIGVNNPAGLSVTNTVARALNPTYPVVTSDAQTVQGQYNYTLTKPFQDNYDSYTVRGDLILSQKQQLFGRYVNFDSYQLSPIVSGGGQANPLLGRNAVLGHTWLLSSSIVNEARVGWNEFYNITNAVNAFPNTRWAAAEGLTNITALANAAQDGRAAFTIQGYTNVADVGGNSGGDQGGHENIMSVGDSLSIVRGKHTFKTGFQYQNRRLWLIADNNARGAATFDNCSTSNCAAGSKTYTEPISGATVYYNKYQNYARGMCTSGCNGNVGTTRGHYRDNTYGAFFNDTWQFGHGLTLTMGLRWEYNSPWVEQNGLEGTLDPTTGLVTFSKLPTNIPAAYETLARTLTAGASGYADYSRTYRPGIVNPQRKGFMPRVGLAYEARTGTVIRAGYGIFLDNLNTNELQFTRYAAPLYFQQNLVNVPVSSLWPDPIANAANLTALPAPFSINPNNSRPYTQEWNASLQQDLGKGMILELAYTGSNTHKLWKRYDQNMCIQVPFVLPSYATSGCTSANRPFKQFGNGVLTSSTRGDSSFNGGSVKIEKRAKGGLFYLGSYQWSKNLDNSSGEAGSNDSSYATDFRFDRSYSNFDNRHRAVISGGYELPFGKGKKWLAGPVGNAIAGGWTLQPAVQLRSGYPFNITSSGCNFANNITCRVWLAPGKTVKDAYRANPSPFNWFDATAFSGSPTTATVTLGSTGYVSSSRTLPSVQGWVTRNVLRGPGTAAVDFSAIKNFKIVERFNAQFRAEAYNILNRAIFSNPAANINTPNTLGKVSSTSIDNRSIQLAIKVLW